MRRYVKDSYGQKYQIRVLEDSNDFFHVELRQGGQYVGEAKCLVRVPDTMELTDIRIRDDSDPPESTIERIMKIAAESKSNMKSYRRRGIGTALLQLVIDHVRERQLSRICGSIVEKDIERTPNLIEWYEKRGFKKGGPYPGCINKAVAWIQLELS
jgi:GNAT superfamily N-acetyltransferase